MGNPWDSLGDLPADLGTDHGQRVETIDQDGRYREKAAPPPERGRQSNQPPGWVRWLAGALVPNLLPALRFSVRPFLAELRSIELSGNKPARRYLLVQNNSPSEMYLNIGSDAGPGTSLVIAAGGYYEPFRVPAGSIHIAAASGASAGILIEG